MLPLHVAPKPTAAMPPSCFLKESRRARWTTALASAAGLDLPLAISIFPVFLGYPTPEFCTSRPVGLLHVGDLSALAVSLRDHDRGSSRYGATLHANLVKGYVLGVHTWQDPSEIVPFHTMIVAMSTCCGQLSMHACTAESCPQLLRPAPELHVRICRSSNKRQNSQSVFGEGKVCCLLCAV